MVGIIGRLHEIVLVMTSVWKDPDGKYASATAERLALIAGALKSLSGKVDAY
jgi:hypothetical protein